MHHLTSMRNAQPTKPWLSSDANAIHGIPFCGTRWILKTRCVVSKESDVETRRSTWHPFWHTTQPASLLREGKYASLETARHRERSQRQTIAGVLQKHVWTISRIFCIHTINWKVSWWTWNLVNWLRNLITSQNNLQGNRKHNYAPSVFFGRHLKINVLTGNICRIRMASTRIRGTVPWY